MANQLAKAIFARHNAKQREAEWRKYLKATEGAKRMWRGQWWRFNYNSEQPPDPRFPGALGADLEELQKKFPEK